MAATAAMCRVERPTRRTVVLEGLRERVKWCNPVFHVLLFWGGAFVCPVNQRDADCVQSIKFGRYDSCFNGDEVIVSVEALQQFADAVECELALA